MQIDDVLEQTMKNIKELDPKSSEDVQRHHSQLVSHSAKALKRNRELKKFLYQNMYQHYSIVRMAKRAEHFLTEIFNSYLDEPLQLPTAHQIRLKDETLYRVVADYIASMTDRSALKEYRHLFDPLTNI